ncbi:MAG: double zinc ribbon domain-containing protein, partial [candidate division WOR-3 bacterium]|nr:double zinc ribbon domain-containing protein [candidate division WOR-3 bacterium]
MHSILKLAQRFLTELKDVLIDLGFPPKCLGCGKELDKGNICDKCFYLVTTNSLGTCVLCGYPKAFNEKCRHPLIRNNNVLLRIRALGKYETPYQNLLHNLKYYECINLGKVLGLGLANLINSDP